MSDFEAKMQQNWISLASATDPAGIVYSTTLAP